MPMSNGTEIFSQYKNDYFVETGSHLGHGVQMAIDAGFKNIISIELADHFVNHCRKRFETCPFVEIVAGDSCEVLWPTIANIKEPITFWLDGHYSCEDTALGKFWSPLMEEIKQIKNHPIKTHTLIIDDMRCWSAENPVIGFGEKQIKDLILEINNKYEFYYKDGHAENDILIASIPC